jgi:signal transduction histidine kinase/ABC-type multidrug transport system ATPase subunit
MHEGRRFPRGGAVVRPHYGRGDVEGGVALTETSTGGVSASGGAPQRPAARLEARGITKRFGRLTVLRDVSLQVGAGEVVAMVGENGAGKSSLVACLARILDVDGGEVLLDGGPLPATPDHVRQAGVEVLWQDHGLCDDLDVVANVFLGREQGRWMIADSRMREATSAVLRRVGAEELPVDRPVRGLSRGQRQLVAMARTLLGEPHTVLLDEPTASLGVAETSRVQDVIRRIRDAGAAVLLVTHDLDEVFALADRVVVLRDGRAVADVSPLEVRRDDIVALMSGIETDSMARRQLERLRSLVDQLTDADAGASLPLIVSAMAVALDQEMLCVHLLESPDGGEPVLRRSAAVGLPDSLLAENERLPLGEDGGCAGVAGAVGNAVVVEDLATHPAADRYRRAAAEAGIRSEWAAPIVGTRGVLGTVTGFARSVGRPEAVQLELARVYLGYAAAAVERERTRREAAALRRSQAIQRELLSSLSHELRTPLTAIQGYASTLLQPDLTWDAASTERFLRSIATEGERMSRLVGDLLDSSAIESGVLWLQRDWCDVRLVVDAAVRVVGRRSPIRVHGGEGLDPVWADHDRVEQVFVNLLENAATHGGSPGGIDVMLRRGEGGATVEVEVADRGPGIPPALADSIFDARVCGEGGGAGLGLSIARGIVEAHGGTLALRGSADGTSFVVTLPSERPPGTAEPGDDDAADDRGGDAGADGSWTFADPPAGDSAGAARVG